LINVFDYVIVGAGSAGCVLADRLSEGGAYTVAVLEAGPKDSSLWIHHPLGLQFVLRHPELEWRLPTLPEPGLNGRQVPFPRGRMFGGSSSANGMLYVRGQQQDYDDWAAAGCTGWAWNDVLPYFVRSEGNDTLKGPLHGEDGPLKVRTLRGDSPLCNALIAAGTELGIPRTDDFNGARQEGAGYYQATIWHGRRWSASRAYLRPALRRANLTAMPDTQVLRVLFEGKRAVGVEVFRHGTVRRIEARREVILSAGAIHSPQLLQVSGIGDPAHLASLGVPVIASSPQVGQNLQDHLQVKIQYKLNQRLTLNDLFHRKHHLIADTVKYLAYRGGRSSEPAIRAGIFCKSSPELDRPDLQFHFIELSSDGIGQPPHRHSGFNMTVCALRPSSRGHVLATTADMRVPPGIVGNFLTRPDDVELTLKGIAVARQLAEQPSLKRLIIEEVDPGKGIVDEASLLSWARGNGVTAYHPAGTCQMGGDQSSVLDPELRVRGVDGLRVVDTSIMPTLISGNTNAPTMMIAERASALILAAV
jgi:choline dehydrogenase